MVEAGDLTPQEPAYREHYADCEVLAHRMYSRVYHAHLTLTAVAPRVPARVVTALWRVGEEEAAEAEAVAGGGGAASAETPSGDQAWSTTCLAASWHRISSRLLTLDFMRGRVAITDRSLSVLRRSVASSSVTLYESISRHSSRYSLRMRLSSSRRLHRSRPGRETGR